MTERDEIVALLTRAYSSGFKQLPGWDSEREADALFVAGWRRAGEDGVSDKCQYCDETLVVEGQTAWTIKLQDGSVVHRACFDSHKKGRRAVEAEVSEYDDAVLFVATEEALKLARADGRRAGLIEAADIVKSHREHQPELMQSAGMRWNIEMLIRAAAEKIKR